MTGAGGTRLSPRLRAILDALPLRAGMHVLEVGCGPGALARAIVHRIGDGHVLAIDRSARAIQQAVAACRAEIAEGRLTLRRAAIEDFVPEAGEGPFDCVIAVRVGALDGRHPAAGRRALGRIADVLAPDGRLFIDGGHPLREIPLG